MMRAIAFALLALCLAACGSAPDPSAVPVTALPTSEPLAGLEPSRAALPRVLPTVPSRPARPFDLPYALLDYLNAAPVNPGRLRTVLTAWGMNTGEAPLPNLGDVLWLGDVDGDGRADLLLALAPAEPASCESGSVVLYLYDGARYRLAQQIGLLGDVPIDPAVSHIPCPRIFSARDLLGDGQVEIVLTSTTCGAHTCNVKVDILRWRQDRLESLITPPSMAYPEITFQPSSRGTADLVLHGGVIGSIGAGPQRERQEIYHWNGSRFALARVVYDASDYLYFKLIDANLLMQQAEYAQAILRYREVLTNSKLELSGLHPNERDDLQAFARFRIMVAYALLGDFDNARSLREELSTSHKGHVYELVGATFFDNYSPNRSVASGCAAVTALAIAQPEVTAVLSGFGYAN